MTIVNSMSIVMKTGCLIEVSEMIMPWRSLPDLGFMITPAFYRSRHAGADGL